MTLKVDFFSFNNVGWDNIKGVISRVVFHLRHVNEFWAGILVSLWFSFLGGGRVLIFVGGGSFVLRISMLMLTSSRMYLSVISSKWDFSSFYLKIQVMVSFVLLIIEIKT